MVFKERTFHGQAPEAIFPQDVADLETKVADCLTAIDGLEATGISVIARGNTIVLSGSVATIEETERAEEAARTVEGVDEVINQLIVV